MTHQDAGFAGSIPQFYDRHMRALLFQPYADDLAVRLRSLVGSDVLETAAGTGILTEALAGVLPPSVRIVATDLNQPMLDHAATKAGLSRVHFQQADAQKLPFPAGSFDAVTCQFGVMFFPDRVAAYREARRVLREGGRFVFNVWDRLATTPVMDAAVAGLQRRYPAHPSWFLERTPCGYFDEGLIRAELSQAGFETSTIETVVRSGHAPDARSAALGLCQGSPLRAEIEGLDPGGLEAATVAVAAMIAERCGSGAFLSSLQALVIETAR